MFLILYMFFPLIFCIYSFFFFRISFNKLFLIFDVQMSSSEHFNHIPTVILEVPLCYENVFGADKQNGINLNIVNTLL